jgi:RimJ/RimL family protein N-acetyltransferase
VSDHQSPPPWLAEPVVTDRLTLRAGRNTPEDREAVVELLTDPRARQFLGGPLAHDDAAAAVSGPAGQRWGSFLLVDRRTDRPGITGSGSVVGTCSLTRDRGELEISFVLRPRYWGQGLALEAVTGVLAWAAEHVEDTHVVAVTQAANARSLHLLQRAGFTERERFVEYGAQQVLLDAELPR